MTRAANDLNAVSATRECEGERAFFHQHRFGNAWNLDRPDIGAPPLMVLGIVRKRVVQVDGRNQTQAAGLGALRPAATGSEEC